MVFVIICQCRIICLSVAVRRIWFASLRSHGATDTGSLESIFDTIDALEKTEIESRVRILYSELFSWFLMPALLLFLLERMLAGTRLRRIP